MKTFFRLLGAVILGGLSVWGVSEGHILTAIFLFGAMIYNLDSHSDPVTTTPEPRQNPFGPTE